jgi:hypothetical protein
MMQCNKDYFVLECFPTACSHFLPSLPSISNIKSENRSSAKRRKHNESGKTLRKEARKRQHYREEDGDDEILLCLSVAESSPFL